MNTKARIKELEDAMRVCWSAMLLADMRVSDPKVKAAFVKVDEKCRATGLLPAPGVKFVYRENA